MSLSSWDQIYLFSNFPTAFQNPLGLEWSCSHFHLSFDTSDQTTLWNIKQASSILLLCSLLNLWDNISQKAAWKFLISPGPSQRLLVVLRGWIHGEKGKCSLLWSCVAFHTSCEKQHNKPRKQLRPLSVYESAFPEWAAQNKWIEEIQQGKPVCSIMWLPSDAVTAILWWKGYHPLLHPEPSSESASGILTWRNPSAVALAGGKTQRGMKSLVN